jgi:hypothetical protein
MKRLMVLAATALLAVAFVVGSASAAGGAAGPGKPSVVLHFLDITTSFSASFQNRPPRLGDQIAFRDNIYRWQGVHRGALVGHANITAAVIAPNLARLSAVAYLPGCTLEVFGDNNFNSNSQTLAVIGGTGTLAGARGEVLTRSLGGPNSNRTAITIRLWR